MNGRVCIFHWFEVILVLRLTTYIFFQGTRAQQRMKKVLREKQAALKTKYKTFERIVNTFNESFADEVVIECPEFEHIRRLSVYDTFWDVGHLTHPTEAWAVDPRTQEGIQAYLVMSHACDELSRVARECRQMIRWSLVVNEKVSVFRTALEIEGA